MIRIQARVQLEKLLGFFDTELGKLILANRDKLRREAPFCHVGEDPASKGRLCRPWYHRWLPSS